MILHTTTMFQYDKELIIGVDEVGRGCVAGNVFACAAALPIGFVFDKLRDSKKMSPKNRQLFFEYAQANGVLLGLGQGSVQEIERLNIRRATHLAMNRAIKNLFDSYEFVTPTNSRIIIDGNDFETGENWKYETLIKGDDLVKAISAASCYAKVYRDCEMAEESKIQNHRYGWQTNSGYGTQQHKAALIEHGPTDLHRMSFVKTLLSK